MLLLKKQYTFDPINQLLLLIKETILPPHQIVFLPTLSLKNILEVKLLIHNNKYDYSKSEFKGSQKKVCIICPIHGEF